MICIKIHFCHYLGVRDVTKKSIKAQFLKPQSAPPNRLEYVPNYTLLLLTLEFKFQTVGFLHDMVMTKSSSTAYSLEYGECISRSTSWATTTIAGGHHSQ